MSEIPGWSGLEPPVEAARRQRSLILRVVRASFFTLIATFTLLSVIQSGSGPGTRELANNWWVYTLAAVLFFGLALLVDLLTPNKKISTMSGVMFGLLAGLLATLALGLVIDLVLATWVQPQSALDTLKPAVSTIKVLLGMSLCYLGIATVLQTQDDFRLVIPYVEFTRQIRGPRPLLLDTSAMIDSRIVDVAGANLIQSPIIVPSFVVAELQTLSDSADGLKRAKGRRGLDAIARLQRTVASEVSVEDWGEPGLAVDQQLVEMARRFQGMIVTTDGALARIALIQQIPVLNVNELANALKPNLVPGESLTLRLIKPGEQQGQGVGYLPDGTMVVAEDGGASVGQTVTLSVTSTLQTSAGRLIFGRIATKSSAGGLAEATLPPPGGHGAPGPDDTGDLTAPPSGAPVADGPPVDTVAGPAPRSRTPFPPNPPHSIRGGTPRNPRR